MIILVSGNVRQGKTLLLAIISLLFMDCGGKVYSNFKLFGEDGKGEFVNGDWSGVLHPNVKIIQPYDLVKLLLGGRCSEAVIISLQEIYAWMSSHQALSQINDFENVFVFQSGKLGYHIISDAQITMRVDSAIRKLANFRYEAECDDEAQCFRYWSLDVRFPNEDIRTGDFFEIPFAVAELFWDRFDSYEPTQPIGLSKMVAEMEKLVPSLMNATIRRQTDLLFAKRFELGFYEVRDCKKVRVENALMELDEVPSFSAYVADRLQLRLR